MNRSLISKLVDIHFSPTYAAYNNLLKEGISSKDIFVTGNTVVDALLMSVKQDFNLSQILPNVDFSKKLILLTVHRRENFGDPMRNIFRAVKNFLNKTLNIEIIFPVHKNPVVRKIVDEELKNKKHIHLIEPLGNEDFVNLMAKCTMVLTDSGGLQEESYRWVNLY